MADNYLETTRTVQYEKAVEFQLNDVTDDLSPLCNFKGGVTGKKVEITDRFGDVYMSDKEERFGKIAFSDNVIERRWIHKPKMSEVHVALDPDDEDATEIALDNPLAQSIARAVVLNRKDKFLQGFYGSASTGEEGTTTVPFKSANIAAADYGETAGTYTGLTLAKLRWIRFRARRLLNDPSVEKIHMGITAYEINDLLKISEYISKDFNPDSQSSSRGTPLSAGAQQALQDGEPTPFMGIMFVPMEFDLPNVFKKSNALGLTTNASGHRRCPVWLPSGMAGREWRGIQLKRNERTDLSGHPWQFSAYHTCAFSRVHEDKCFIVETNGAGT